MDLKFQKFLGGMPSDPPGAHTCDERTASSSPTPRVEGSKYISMERNNISEFPHVPLGAPYREEGGWREVGTIEGTVREVGN